MKKMFLAIFILLMVTTLSASTVQGWSESGPFSIATTATTFDKIELFAMSPGNTFDSPGATDFSVGGWSGSLVNPNYTVMTGPGTSSIQWNQYFTNPDGKYDFLAWKGTELVDAAHVTYNGSSVVPFSSVDIEYSRTAVPEPLTYSLMGIGLLCFSVISRRKKAKE